MKYQTRLRRVEAVQWTGQNLDEVRSICPDAHTIESGWTLAVPIPPEHRIAESANFLMARILVAHVGHYVVRTEAGRCYPMAPVGFEWGYEAVPVPETPEVAEVANGPANGLAFADLRRLRDSLVLRTCQGCDEVVASKDALDCTMHCDNCRAKRGLPPIAKQTTQGDP